LRGYGDRQNSNTNQEGDSIVANFALCLFLAKLLLLLVFSQLVRRAAEQILLLLFRCHDIPPGFVDLPILRTSASLLGE
jgi:hypothetical protein